MIYTASHPLPTASADSVYVPRNRKSLVTRELQHNFILHGIHQWIFPTPHLYKHFMQFDYLKENLSTSIVQGPVFQSFISLTSSLVIKMVTVPVSTISNSQVIF